jgi:hypothetical protein
MIDEYILGRYEASLVQKYDALNLDRDHSRDSENIFPAFKFF